MTAIIEISRDDADLRVEVKGVYVAGHRGHRDRYGAPEEPDEPAYIEIETAAVVEDVADDTGKVLYRSGQLLELTPDEDQQAQDAIWEQLDSNEPDYDPIYDDETT